MKKFMSILLTLVLVGVFCIMPCAMATTIKPGSAISGTTPTDASLDVAVKSIIGAIRWAGFIVATCLIMYIGIKYLMASAAEKADLKGMLVKYIVGAGLIIAGTQIAAWIFSLQTGAPGTVG